LHMAQLMALPLTVSCFSKIQICFTFLVLAHPGSPGQRAVKLVCVCVCVRACVMLESRVAELDRKQAARKQQVINTTGTVWPCDRCTRTCSSRIGLFAHRRATHR